MGLLSDRFYKSLHKRYRRAEKIRTYYLAGDGEHRWMEEVIRRAAGLTTVWDEYHFSPHCPLTDPRALKYIVERYQPAFEYLDEHPAESLLELGCGFGISCWLFTDLAKSVTGVDSSDAAVATANHMFPEASFVAADWRQFLEASPRRWDVIVNCGGPVSTRDASQIEFLRTRCERYIHIQYRAHSWEEFARRTHRAPGRQLSFDATLVGEGMRGLSPRYPKYYLGWNYMRAVRHALRRRYYPPY